MLPEGTGTGLISRTLPLNEIKGLSLSLILFLNFGKFWY